MSDNESNIKDKLKNFLYYIIFCALAIILSIFSIRTIFGDGQHPNFKFITELCIFVFFLSIAFLISRRLTTETDTTEDSKEHWKDLQKKIFESLLEPLCYAFLISFGTFIAIFSADKIFNFEQLPLFKNPVAVSVLMFFLSFALLIIAHKSDDCFASLPDPKDQNDQLGNIIITMSKNMTSCYKITHTQVRRAFACFAVSCIIALSFTLYCVDTIANKKSETNISASVQETTETDTSVSSVETTENSTFDPSTLIIAICTICLDILAGSTYVLYRDSVAQFNFYHAEILKDNAMIMAYEFAKQIKDSTVTNAEADFVTQNNGTSKATPPTSNADVSSVPTNSETSKATPPTRNAALMKLIDAQIERCKTMTPPGPYLKKDSRNNGGGEA